MSRIGKEAITIPKGVEVNLKKADLISVKGPKGILEKQTHSDIVIERIDNKLHFKRPDDLHFHRALHGLTRTLVQNMILGVTKGYSKELEIVGVGYKAEKKGKNLMLSLGYSHPILLVPPEGILIEVPAPTAIIVTGIDKELVGELAAKIRSFRKPEPYKGKGIRYKGEYVARKAGKYAK
jgi:large subunit ribosomal protein L6